MNLFSPRQMFALGFLGCVGGMAFALYLEYVVHLEPCPLCIFQRIAMISAGLVFLAGAIHGPRGKGRWVYSLLATSAALAGVGLALRHLWLQSLPPDQAPACGPTLDYLMSMMPFREVVEIVLRGDGECAKINGIWFGITLPGWTLIAFALMAFYAFTIPLVARKGNSQREFPA